MKLSFCSCLWIYENPIQNYTKKLSYIYINKFKKNSPKKELDFDRDINRRKLGKG